MDIDKCYYLGYVSKAIGNKGELAFKLDVDSPSSYESLDVVFIQIQKNNKELVPYFIKKARLQNNSLLRIELEDITDQEQSKALIGKELYLPLDVLPALTGNQFYFHEVIDFTVIDVEHGILGTIKQVLDYPAGSLFEVQKDDKEILVPISNESIVNVDREQKTIRVRTPEGLVNLYL